MSATFVARNESSIKVYVDICTTFMNGYVRLLEAESAHARLIAALLTYRTRSFPESQSPEVQELISQIRRISPSSYRSLTYVTDISLLVYATTLLDTFLTETTTFLFLLLPATMGKNQQVPLRMLIDAKSRNAALSHAAAARAREISYKSFEDRLQFLRDTFGLPIKLDNDALCDLQHYSSIRNSAVHDQGIFDLRLDDAGDIVNQLRTCPDHPTSLTSDDPYKAATSYKRISFIVGKDVLTTVLKVDLTTFPPDLKRLFGV
jgi:hypothetical protein